MVEYPYEGMTLYEGICVCHILCEGNGDMIMMLGNIMVEQWPNHLLLQVGKE